MACISILEKFAKSLNNNQKGFIAGGKNFTKNFLLCMQAFLLFIAKNPYMMSTLKTFIESMKAVIDLQISLLELIILQLDIENQILNAILQPYKALQEGIAGQLAILPLAEFTNCPPIESLHQSFIKGFDAASGTGPLAKMRSIKQWVKRKEFELTHRRTYADKLRAKVEELRTTELMLDALAEMIECIVLSTTI